MHTHRLPRLPRFPWITGTALALAIALPAFFAPASNAAPAGRPAAAVQPYDAAMQSFRSARFSEAYGRLVALADQGHAPAAAVALWMYQNGPTLFDKDWDSSPHQLAAWARLAGQPAPVMTARTYTQPVLVTAQR